MTDNVNKKYERNRSNWRKVYSYHRRKPNLVNLTDTETSETFTYDLQQITRNRDFYILSKGETQEAPVGNFIVDEANNILTDESGNGIIYA